MNNLNIKAVIYTRTAADQHGEGESLSMEEQIQKCKTHAEAHELDVVDICNDYLQSGLSEHRPALTHAINLIATEVHSKFIVTSMDRLGSDYLLAANIRKCLELLGAEVIVVDTEVA